MTAFRGTDRKEISTYAFRGARRDPFTSYYVRATSTDNVFAYSAVTIRAQGLYRRTIHRWHAPWTIFGCAVLQSERRTLTWAPSAHPRRSSTRSSTYPSLWICRYDGGFASRADFIDAEAVPCSRSVWAHCVAHRREACAVWGGERCSVVLSLL